MKRLAFLALFAAAVWLLSSALAVWRAAAASPSLEAWLRAGLVWGLLALAVMTLGLQLYAHDRAAGRVRRRIRLYEWVLSRVGARDA